MLYLLCIALDGYATVRDGDDRWSYRRWALCASSDGRSPYRCYRNGGPVALTRPTAAKEPPAWQHRAVGYVAAVGGLPLAALEEVVLWYRSHRTGTFPAAFHREDAAAK